MADAIAPGEQTPLRRFRLHIEMAVRNALFHRAAQISRINAGVHVTQFLYWNGPPEVCWGGRS
jgi:hypothetical protein